MNKNDVPQDNSRTYSGHRKVIYATDEKGSYERVESSGWEAEEFATVMAVEQLEEQAQDALARVHQGLSAPLEYHMYNKRLDIPQLAQVTGLFQWQVKRHLKPTVFTKLSHSKLQRYADALGLSITALQSVPAP
jgi:hypothetical protein